MGLAPERARGLVPGRVQEEAEAEREPVLAREQAPEPAAAAAAGVAGC